MSNLEITDNKKNLGKLDQFLRIGAALTSEKNIGTLLEIIVDSARLISNADGGTLYIIDQSSKNLVYEILQNDTTKTRLSRSRDDKDLSESTIMITPGRERRKHKRPEEPVDIMPPPVPLYIDGEPNNENVSSYVALHCEIVNIPDVYDGQTFNFSGPKAYDTAKGYRTKSMLVIPLVNHASEVIGVLQLINAKEAETGIVIPFSEEDVSFVSSLASLAAVALSNANLIERLFHDIEEIKQLRNAEKQLNNNLREAYLRTEDVNNDLTTALKKVRVIRRVSMVFGSLIVVGLVSFFLFSGSIMPSVLPSMSQAPKKQEVTKVYKVVPQPISSTLSLGGVLEPIKAFNVVSPISGKVREIYFHYGEIVTAGQPLVQMDTSEVDVRLREAQTANDRAAEKLDEVRKWKDGQEAVRVKRSLTKAKLSLDAQKKTFENTERLFKRGLVSASEYEAAKQQYASQMLDLQTAQEELQATLQKGDAANVNIALREKKNAETRLRELERQQRMSRIIAPVTGVVTLSGGKVAGAETKKIDAGSPVQEGGLLFTIGDLTGFSIKARIDEVNITKVKQDQTVLITGDAFPGITLRGRIMKISSQASVDQAGASSGAPSFEVIVIVDNIPPEHRSRVFFGMSASLEVLIHEKADALMVPVSAVQIEGAKRFVTKKVLDGQGTHYQKTEVTTGYSTIDAVEITSGLKAGDELLVTVQ